MSVCTLLACLVPDEARRSQLSWNRSYRWLSTAMWVLNSNAGLNSRCILAAAHLSSPLSALLVSELTIFDFAFSPYFNFFILNYVYVDMGVWMHMNKGLLEARRGSRVWSWSYWQFWAANSGPP